MLPRVGQLLSIAILGTTLLACPIGMGTVLFLAPRGGNTMVGVSITTGKAAVRLPRRALTCIPATGWSETCTMQLAGEEFRLEIQYGPPSTFEFPQCRASYRAATTTCHPVNVTLGAGIPRYAGMHNTALGIDPAALQAMRDRYWFDNLYEADWLALRTRAALFLASAIALGSLLAPWPHPAIRPVAAVAAGMLSFAALRACFLALLVLTGLVD